MCRYVNNGVIEIKTKKELEALKKALSKKPNNERFGEPSDCTFRPEFWKK